MNPSWWDIFLRVRIENLPKLRNLRSFKFMKEKIL